MKGRSKKSNQTGSGRRKRRIRPPKDDPAATPIWDVAQALAARVPDREWRTVPSDLARNLHHYLGGGSFRQTWRETCTTTSVADRETRPSETRIRHPL